MIPTHYICILVVTTLKMATWVAEACRWSLYNEITFINLSTFVGLCNMFHVSVTSVWGTSVGIATRYCLDGPGIESR